MELLKNKILTEGKAMGGHILKVDSFLNHCIDPKFMQDVGKEFYNRFKHLPITKVLTVESSGIAPAVFTAIEFGVSVVFAKKRKSLTLNENLLTAEVYSYTKQELNTITISKDYINENDNILIIDDFLARGEVAKGLISLIKSANANIAGVGIVIEKSFQEGRASVDALGIKVESLARVKSLENDKVTFVE